MHWRQIPHHPWVIGALMALGVTLCNRFVSPTAAEAFGIGFAGLIVVVQVIRGLRAWLKQSSK